MDWKVTVERVAGAEMQVMEKGTKSENGLKMHFM
jgi:hypothetical protein